MWSRWWGTWSRSYWLGSVLTFTPPCTISSAACPSLTSVSPLSLPPNAGELCDREEYYLLPSMYDSTLLLPCSVISECHMLAVLAYDCYVAICNPLLYNVTMSYQLCSCMVVGVYIMGLTGATAHTGCMLRVLFCKADVINHYLCDLFPLLELSCSSIYINEVVVLCFSAFNILTPLLTILSSYIFIIFNILQIHSKEGRSKAFSTCSSHISAVAIFYGSAAFMYLQPSSVSSMDHGKVSSVFYTIIVPMLNALIYSLRNKDVKIAFNKILEKKSLLRKWIFCLGKNL